MAEMDNKIDGVRQQNKESLKALKTAVTLAMLAFAGGGVKPLRLKILYL